MAKGRGREAPTRALGRGPEGYGRCCSYASEHGEPKRGTGTSGEFVTSGIRCLKHPVATGSGEGRALLKGWGQKPASHPTLLVHTGGGHAHPLWPRTCTAATLHIHGREASEQLPSQEHPSGTSDLGNHFEGVDGQPVWGLLSACGMVRGQAPPRPKALSEDSGPLPGLGGHCSPAALSGVFPQRPVSAGTMPALWAPLPAGSGGKGGGPALSHSVQFTPSSGHNSGLQGPHITSGPVGAAQPAGPGQGPGRPRQQVAQIGTPSPADAGTPPASAGVAWGQRRGQGPQG